jgi:hypothetical protein
MSIPTERRPVLKLEAQTWRNPANGDEIGTCKHGNRWVKRATESFNLACCTKNPDTHWCSPAIYDDNNGLDAAFVTEVYTTPGMERTA